MDATWPDSAAYACHCGTMYAVTYWRWVDVVARPELDAQVQRDGPYEGQCPDCGAAARSAGTWLRIDMGLRDASLQVAGAQRGSLLRLLREHLDAVEQRPHAVRPWMLQPTPVFYELGEGELSRAPRVDPIIPARSGELFIDVPPLPESPALEAVAAAPRAVPAEPAPGVPQVIGADTRTPGTFRPPVLGAYVGTLALEDDHVVAVAEVDGSEAGQWSGAKIQVRPILLREPEYPLLGVRIVASYLGQKAIVDAVHDPGDPQGGEIFRRLSRRFALTLRVAPGDEEPVERGADAEGLEPNAALCLESARTVLARGQFPPEDYAAARERLAARDVETRLAPAEVTIASGAYQHIVGASEAVTALQHLDRLSSKESLARLLEVDGLPMAEYDAIRRRVLQGSLDHGLVAPRRFWRRMVASGLVSDLATYAERLCEARAALQGEEGDLEPDAARTAWEEILELCRRKELPLPASLSAALGLDGDSPPPEVAHNASPAAGHAVGDARLRDPEHRLKVAADVLQGREHGELDDVFAVLDQFDDDELLALLPDLSEMGHRVVPRLIEKLDSERREVRQAATILLGMALDPQALEPLADRLVQEPSSMWLDIARALGAFGPTALRRLCQVLRREGGTDGEQFAVERVARALAEVALSDGDVGPGDPSPGHDAVGALADAGDPRVRAAARRALATLRAVSESSAAVRGELPLPENTKVRGFARRAYEAIMVPEVEVEAEA